MGWWVWRGGDCVGVWGCVYSRLQAHMRGMDRGQWPPLHLRWQRSISQLLSNRAKRKRLGSEASRHRKAISNKANPNRDLFGQFGSRTGDEHGTQNCRTPTGDAKTKPERRHWAHHKSPAICVARREATHFWVSSSTAGKMRIAFGSPVGRRFRHAKHYAGPIFAFASRSWRRSGYPGDARGFLGSGKPKKN